MAETKQISATIDIDLANWITSVADKEKRTNSKMIEILLEEAKNNREAIKEKLQKLKK
jgi:hypothetical protein